MKRSRTLIMTLLILGPMAVALPALASNSSYAYDSVGSPCSPYYHYYDSSCADLYPYGFYDRAGDWWRHNHYHGYDHGAVRGFDHGGFSHGSFGLGDFAGGHAGGGHDR